MQFDVILSFLAEAKAAGFKVLTGGNAEPGPGYFVEPTIVYQPEESSRIMREEVFGPVQCVAVFEDEEEVLERANNTEYGLYSSVFTRDVFRAIRIAKKFEAGNVGVNVASPFMTHDMPFGGWKQSGQGTELSKNTIDERTETKTVYFAES